MVRPRGVICWAIGIALCAMSRAQAAEEIRSANVEIPGGRGPIRGYLARPRAAGAVPPIVMIHEEWGLTARVRGNADRLAADGYAVLAVDLFAGKTTDDPAAARDLMRNMSLREARADLRLGVSFLLTHPGIDNSRKVGAIGWSMGGGLARELAETTDAISPAAI